MMGMHRENMGRNKSSMLIIQEEAITDAPTRLNNCAKQVQQIEDDPPKFETIYYGHHTCKIMLKIVGHSSTCNDSSIIFNFENNGDLFFSSVKKESNEDYRPISEITYNGYSSAADYIFSPHNCDHLTGFDVPSVLSADDHDVIFVVVGSIDLDDFCFSFEEDS